MIFHDVEQNSDEWLALRVGKLTGSSVSRVMANFGKAFGDPAKQLAIQIALEQINGYSTKEHYSNEHMERGHAQEPIARMLYEDAKFTDVSNGGFFDCGTWGDSPDGLVAESGVVEIKAVLGHVQYKTIERGTYDPSYKWQIANHLDCTERDWVDYVSYSADYPIGKQLYIYRIDRDMFKEELKMLAERRDEFMAHVEKCKANILEKAA